MSLLVAIQLQALLRREKNPTRRVTGGVLSVSGRVIAGGPCDPAEMYSPSTSTMSAGA